jgi:hypothetical protein
MAISCHGRDKDESSLGLKSGMIRQRGRARWVPMAACRQWCHGKTSWPCAHFVNADKSGISTCKAIATLRPGPPPPSLTTAGRFSNGLRSLALAASRRWCPRAPPNCGRGKAVRHHCCVSWLLRFLKTSSALHVQRRSNGRRRRWRRGLLLRRYLGISFSRLG